MISNIHEIIMDDHPFAAVVSDPSENSELVLRPEEPKSEKPMPDHPMDIQPSMLEDEVSLSDRFVASIDTIILKKTQEISQLHNIKSQYSPMLEKGHVEKILSNSFLQPIFAAEDGKANGSRLFSLIQEEDRPSVISSNLSNLVNYSSISGDFSSLSSMLVNNATLSDARLNWKGRSLQVSPDKILLTGGSVHNAQTLLINTSTHEIHELGPLQAGRELHAMAWIDNKPAVLGGIDSNNWPLGSVEVFAKGCWEKAKSMNSRRYGLSACTVKNSVWVFGGAESKANGIVNIEFYQEGSWRTSLKKIPQSLVGIGLISLGDNILLLGGMSNEGTNTSRVLLFNTEDCQLRECKSLETPCSFSQNLWKVHSNFFEGYTFRGNQILYRLE